MARSPVRRILRSSRAAGRPQVPFPCKLVLNQWLLSLFNVQRLRGPGRAPAQRGAGRAGREQHPPLPPRADFPALQPHRVADRVAAGIRPEHRAAHAAAQRTAHHARRRADRLEVLPVSGATVHRNLPRPLLPRSQGAARGAERTDGRVQRRQAPSRPNRTTGRDGRGLAATEQAGVLDGHRQRQDAADARQHLAVPVLPGEARPAHAN